MAYDPMCESLPTFGKKVKDYLSVKMPYRYQRINGQHIKLHIWVMEQTIGRKLFRDECVHHIDGSKLNNSINNLRLMTNSEHAICHNNLEKYVGILTKQNVVQFSNGEYFK